MRNLLLALALTCSYPVVVRAAPSPPAASNPYAETPEGKLAAQRVVAAQKAYDSVVGRWKAGQARIDDVYLWSMRVLESRLDHTTGLDPDDALKAHAARMHDVETMVQALYRRGVASSADLALATYYRIDADLRYADDRVE